MPDTYYTEDNTEKSEAVAAKVLAALTAVTEARNIAGDAFGADDPRTRAIDEIYFGMFDLFAHFRKPLPVPINSGEALLDICPCVGECT